MGVRFARIDDRIIAAAVAVCVLYVGARYATRVAGGADSYGYISQAEHWARGMVTVPQPWAEGLPWPDSPHTFAPLGYRPARNRLGIVPTYAPGLPMLMAGASLVAGHCAMFWVVPISGALLVFGTFLLGRRLGSSRGGLAAAALVASSPAFLYMLPQAMSDVPVAAAWTWAFIGLVGVTQRSAAFGGLAAGIAILIRPNLVPMAGVLVGWLAFNVWRATVPERARQIRRALWFAATLAPGIIVVALLNLKMYGSPFRSGYGDLEQLFGWSNIVPNVGMYALWFSETQTVLPLIGWLAIAFPRRTLWPAATDPLVVPVLGLFVVLVWLQYCAYSVFDAWWYLRFLLSCWPLIMIGFAQLGWRLSQKSTAAAVLFTLVVIALVVRGTWIAVQESSFTSWQGERRYVEVAELVRSMTEPTSVIISNQHSGALRFHGGRMTMNTGWMREEWLDRTIAWLQARGVHPYLLVDDWELVRFKRIFAGQTTVGLLDAPPLLVYRTAGTTFLFDLRSGAKDHSPLDVREVPSPHPRCTPPAAPPRLALR